MLEYCLDADTRRDERRGAATSDDSGRYGRHGCPPALPGERSPGRPCASDARRPPGSGLHRRAVPGAGARAGRREWDLLSARRAHRNDTAAGILLWVVGQRTRSTLLPCATLLLRD